MDGLPPTLEKVIKGFSKFPGIGKKTAHRLGLHVLKTSSKEIEDFSQALINVKTKINTCNNCHNIAEADLCEICTDEKRDSSIICICEDPSDIYLIEKTGFRGVYHVLGGLLSPLDGIGPDDLQIDSLIERVKTATELIVATDTSIEGEATILYISKLLETQPIKMTRLARGLPVGGQLEYVDEATLTRSINERVELN
ncbi:MAG: recombination protein RecR [Candidatus Marinimicrobia bacterium]|nr:recombination protein RecR [Candidatus Neomarinimicrobiota bacterium]